MTLLELQRRMASAIMRPLAPGDRLSSRTAGGRSMRADAAEYIKPNDRLSSVERLEIYSRSYWFRLLDSLYDDFPGLRAILGSRAFYRLSRAYLAECPSRSFTMRDAGQRLESWLREQPEHAGSNPALALDMVRLEWAHIEAFDNEERAALGPEDLLELGPALRLGLQPHISLLELQYPVDDLRVRLNATAEEHGAVSNAVLRRKERGLVRRVSRLAPERVFLAVHRFDLMVYYRRLSAEEFRLLDALRRGEPVGVAVETSLADSALPLEDLSRSLETWFASWAALGWFCRAEAGAGT